MPRAEDFANPDFLIGKEVWFMYGLEYDECERLRGGWRRGTVQLNKQKSLGWRLQIRHPAIKGLGGAVTILAELATATYITEKGPDVDGAWALAASKQAEPGPKKRSRANQGARMIKSARTK